MEARYRLTRGCLKILQEYGWGADILTRSPLVTRDLDILKEMPEVSVGFSIPTDDDRVRSILEPQAPPIAARLKALAHLHTAGLHTWVFVAPMLPMHPERLYEAVAPHIDHLMVDRLNYRQQVQAIFRKHGWEYALDRGVWPGNRRLAAPEVERGKFLHRTGLKNSVFSNARALH